MSLNSLICFPSNSATTSCAHVLFLSIFLELFDLLWGVSLAPSLVHWLSLFGFVFRRTKYRTSSQSRQLSINIKTYKLHLVLKCLSRVMSTLNRKKITCTHCSSLGKLCKKHMTVKGTCQNEVVQVSHSRKSCSPWVNIQSAVN